VRLVAACLAFLALGCAAPGAGGSPSGGAPSAGSAPDVRAEVRPEARVLALSVQPSAGGWRVSGRLSLPRPVLASEARALLEGLDAEGRSLWVRDATLELDQGGPRRRRTARLVAEVPADQGLAGLRVSLPAEH
jgi:hypothetical protein